MKLRKLVERAHQNAVDKGFYENDVQSPEWIAARLCMIHSEVSEALEAARRDHVHGDDFAEELADIMIRVADVCGWLEIDIEQAIASKMELNAERPHKHGKLI